MIQILELLVVGILSGCGKAIKVMLRDSVKNSRKGPEGQTLEV